MIVSALPVGPFEANCYVVGSENTGEGMLIDPGDEADEILGNVAGQKLHISLVVLTHGHIDHIGAVKEVKDATKASVAIHADDAKTLTKNATGNMLGLSYPAPPAPDRLLKEGDTIKVGDLTFTVLHTPGHSPGSICLYGEGVLFSGDTLFREGIGRYDLPGGNYAALMNSLHRLLTLPPDTVVYPGHGPKTTIGTEKKENPFLAE
jgi:glyoxylase-like metal-dependent hydrolase (beta-lactamase superfamily II)